MSVTNLCNMLNRLDDSTNMLEQWEASLTAQITAVQSRGEDMREHAHLFLHRGQVGKSLARWQAAVEDYTRALGEFSLFSSCVAHMVQS
jgi:hypothetical protein